MITIVQLNCRGFWNNRHLISEAITAIDPDIVLLNDTGITPRPIKLYGYNTRQTTGAAHEGVAVMVKSTLKHIHVAEWPTPHFLATKIDTQHGQLLVATTYCRPNTGLPLNSLTNLFNHTHIPVYILADLNARHTAFRHTTNNQHGHELLQLQQLKRLRFLGPDFPTCFTYRGSGRPDLILSNRQSLPFHHHISHGPLCGSDHVPLILKISTNPIAIPSPPISDYSSVNWDDFKNTLTNTHQPTYLDGQHHTEIDNAIERLQTDIITSANRHIPKKRHKIYRDFKPSIRTQRLNICYQTLFQRNKHNLRPANINLTALRGHLLHSLQSDHDAHWLALVSRMDGTRCRNPTQFWRSVHRLRGSQRERFEYLLVDGAKISDTQQVANTFQTHWERIFHPHPLPIHEPSATHINNIERNMHRHRHDTRPHDTIQLTRLSHQHLLTTPVEEEDVSRLLRRTPRRAPGPSGITWPVVKNLPPPIISSLTAIFNASLASGYFPKAFKTSNIILIEKPEKDPHLPENYRPISLLSIIGKTFERILNRRLRLHLDAYELLSPQQFGFRSHASTEDALNTIIAYCQNSPRHKVALVTKDVKKAFDTVWHTGLKYKICNNFRLPSLTKKLLSNFLEDRRTRIKHLNAFSIFFNTKAGVPQGSVLSPTLFNMYTADLPRPIHNDSLTIQYADDVTQLSRARDLDRLTTRIQQELTPTSLWELKWRIQSHPEKSKVTYLEKRSNRNPRQISLYNFLPNPVPIPISRNNKVLGLNIDKHLRFHVHVRQKAAIARTSLSNLERFRDSSTKTKLHLFKAFILPLLTYCPLALSLAAKTNISKLQVVQNRALRFALGVRWYDFRTTLSLHEETDIDPINITHYNRTVKQLISFQDRHTDTYDFIHSLHPTNTPLDPSPAPPLPSYR